MARGWESKSVEEQQEEKLRSRPQAADSRTAEERARAVKREKWRLAMAQTQAELQRACHPAHRDMLRLRMEAIQTELKACEND
jgi:hypothetical protein